MESTLDFLPLCMFVVIMLVLYIYFFEIGRNSRASLHKSLSQSKYLTRNSVHMYSLLERI